MSQKCAEDRPERRLAWQRASSHMFEGECRLIAVRSEK